MVTIADVQEFAQFAGEQVTRGEVASLSELALAWEDARELESTIKALRQSEADLAAGRTMSVEEAFASVRQKLGLGQ